MVSYSKVNSQRSRTQATTKDREYYSQAKGLFQSKSSRK
jgi:hypothetical protein